jgi:hypothetical protein
MKIVMDAVANYPQHEMKSEELQRRPSRHGHCGAFLHLLAAFGILAFIFSAASPYDDDIQQESCQTSNSTQCVLANYKTVSNLGASRICTVHSAHASSTPAVASDCVTGGVSVPDDEIKDRVCRSAPGDRSPPIESS